MTLHATHPSPYSEECPTCTGYDITEGTTALTGCWLLSCVSVGFLAAVFGLAVLLTWRRMK